MAKSLPLAKQINEVFSGKRVIKPSKVTKEMDANRELSKFINHCNEVKAATAANKEGGQLSIVKHLTESTSGAQK